MKRLSALEKKIVHNDEYQSPGKLRVVCDTMLQGTGRYLRSCGVDVKIMENHEDHDVAIQSGLKEERIILSSGNPYKKILSHVGQDACYDVISQGAQDQATEVLRHFNVKVTPQDIFSRCQVCNGDEYVKMPSSDMTILSDRKDFLIGSGDTVLSLTSNPYDNQSLSKRFEEEYGIEFSNLTFMKSQAFIKIELIPKAMITKVDWFYVCATCGKIFWEGSHFSRICDQFSHILTLTEQDTNIYDHILNS
ncbi:hypothetical protein SNE40_015538 [Patella caerulea]|uniref:Mut7-C RNAse domain-containing protein n=1 Tax=Patella caerulea TaxID=87958 RepID=A0AAN8PVC5_PATCE